MKKQSEELINPDFKIQDSEMQTGAEYTHGSQTYKLTFFNGETVKLYNEAEDWTHEERRNYFQRFYCRKQ